MKFVKHKKYYIIVALIISMAVIYIILKYLHSGEVQLNNLLNSNQILENVETNRGKLFLWESVESSTTKFNEAVTVISTGKIKRSPYSISLDNSNNFFFTSYSSADNFGIYKYNIKEKKMTRANSLRRATEFKGYLIISVKNEHSFLIDDYHGMKLYQVDLIGNNVKIRKITDVATPIVGLYYNHSFENIVLLTSGGSITQIDKFGKKKSLLHDTTLLEGPQGIVITNEGDLYVGDTMGGFLLQIKKDGRIFRLKSDYIHEPRGLTVDRFNNIYITDTTNSIGRGGKGTDGYVLKFDSDNNKLYILKKTHNVLQRLMKIKKTFIHLEKIAYNANNNRLYLAALNLRKIVETSLDKEKMVPVEIIREEIPTRELEKFKRAIITSKKLNISLNNNPINIIQEIPFLQIKEEEFKGSIQAYDFVSKTGKCMKNWDIRGKAKKITCKRIDLYENSEIVKKDAVEISTNSEFVRARPAYGQKYLIDAFHDKTLAGKKVIFSAWVKTSKPGCIRLGVYRGNLFLSGLSPFNTIGNKNEYELLVYEGKFDVPYTSAHPLFLMEPFCEVEITNPLLLVPGEK